MNNMNRTFNFINNKKSSIAFGQPNLSPVTEGLPSIDYLAIHKVQFQDILAELRAEYNQKKFCSV